MKQLSKLCLILSIAVPIAYIVLEYAFDVYVSSIIMDAVVAFCIVPVVTSGMWLWFSEDAGKYLNGTPNLHGNDRHRAANLIGFDLTLSGFVMSLGLGLVLSNGSTYGIFIILLSVILILIPYAYCNEKRIHTVGIPFENRSRKAKNALITVASVAVLIPIAAFAGSESNEVTVTFEESSFTVKAPSFEHSFNYEDVNELSLDENFDKGNRAHGYKSPKISSGKFNNSSFSDYYLASYTKVEPCIVFSVGGTMYAFNQADAEKTGQMYDLLYSKINPF